jgi:predicted permease
MRLMRMVMTESILLAVLGSVLGVFLAWAGTRMLMAAAPVSLPRLDEVALSWRALAFTGGVSILTGVLVGLAPTLRMGSPRLLASLQDSGRGGTAGGGRLRFRNLLVVSQTGVCLLLLVGAGLMVRSFRELRAIDPGFRSSGVLTFRVAPSWAKYQQPEDIAAFYDQFLGEIRALPGVVAAGASTLLPLGGEGGRVATQIEEFPTEAGKLPPVFLIRRVTPGYFSAIGVRLHEGREMNRDDHAQRLGSAVVSESLKKRYWPRESALGKRITATGSPSSVVGVVGDIPHEGVDKPFVETVYISMLDAIPGPTVNSYSVAVRAEVAPLGLVPQIRQVAERIDPDLPMTDVRLMDEVVASSMSRTTFTMWLLVVAAAAGLFLAGVGVYGVTSYVVSQRTREIGIRLALGAEPSAIRAMVLRQGMLLAAVGIGLGLIGSAILGRVVASLLFGVTPYDAATLLLAPVVVLIATALALAIPSHSAAATEPAVALGAE